MDRRERHPHAGLAAVQQRGYLVRRDSGQTGPTYLLDAADVGNTIVLRETATNISGSPTADSPPTAVIARNPPVISTAPTITGNAVVSSTLSEGPASWSSSVTPAITLQWRRCDLTGSNCTAIGGETQPNYTVRSADIGHTIVVRETANNGAVSATSADSAPTDPVPQPSSSTPPPTPPPPVSPSAPANTAPPTIAGTAQDGQVLSETHGSWTNSPTGFTVAWERCDKSGTSCAAIAGESGSSYAVRPADVGHTIRVKETASNAAGFGTPATSAATAPVTAANGGVGKAAVASALAASLSPSALTVSLTALLHQGHLALSVSLPEAGSVTVRWLAGSHNGARRLAGTAAATVIASGTGRVAARRTTTLSLQFNAAGKRFLATSHGRVKLTAQGTFTPAGGRAVATSRTIAVGHVRSRGSQIGAYRIPTSHSGPTGVAAGSAGQLWFTEWNVGKLARVSASGRVTELNISAKARPWGIAQGAAGLLWFTDRGTNSIGAATSAGHVTEYPLHTPAPADPTSIAVGPRGAMRFTETAAGAIGSIDVRTHAIVQTALPSGSGAPMNIASDGTGNDFFDALDSKTHALQIGEITAAGKITIHALRTGSRYGSYPGSIGVGRNRAGQVVVYTLDDGDHAVAAYNASTGAARFFGYPHGTQFAQGLIVARDGSVWYTPQKAGTVDRLDPATGVTTPYRTKPAAIQPDGIAQGADGTIWFLDWMNDVVYRVASGQCPVALCLAVAKG